MIVHRQGDEHVNKIFVLIEKEWADVFRYRSVLIQVLGLPLIIVGLPVVALAAGITPGFISGFGYDPPPALVAQPPYNALTAHDAQRTFMGQQFNLLFLIVPLAIPMTIATYSIVGEKRERSLEPLLATPISTAQLLAAKSLAAAGPGVLETWLSALVYALALPVVLPNPLMRAILLSPSFFVTVGLIAPLLTILATTVGLSVSSRVDDPRVAEQLGMIVIVPVLALMVGQIAGLFVFDLQLALVVAGGLAVVDLVLLQVAVRLFKRETILTRWK